MEIFQQLKESLASSVEESFNHAFHALSEESRRLTSLTQDYERREGMHLQHIRVLEEQLAYADKPCEEDSHARDSSFCEPQLQKFQDEFSPENVFQNFTNLECANQGDELFQVLKLVEKKYRILFQNFKGTAMANMTLRKQSKRHKDKISRWKTFLSANSSQQVEQSHANTRCDQISHGATTAKEADMHKPVQTCPNSIISLPTPIQKNAPLQLLDPSSKCEPETRPVVVHITSDVGLSLSQPDPRSVRPILRPQTRPFSDSNSRPQSEVNKMLDHTQPIISTSNPTVAETALLPPKQEPLEDTVIIKGDPSSPNTRLVELSSSLTQDLDELGSPVKTPRKQFAVFMDAVTMSEPSARLWRSNHSDVLQRSNTNAKRVTDILVNPGSKRVKLKEENLKIRVNNVAEDGEEENFDSRFPRWTKNTRVFPTVSSNRNIFADQRLINLLDTPSNTESRRGYYGEAEASSMNDACTKPRQGLVENPFNVPYRKRPLNTLHLDCFKINAERNRGFNFAFSEVVRGKNQRKCLSGCMREECCGSKFRAMARVGDPSYSPNQLPGDGLRNEDRLLLEQYFDGEEQVLQSMNTEDQRNILVEIKARMLSDKYGKHRFLSDRPRSPPGFWRTDMPTSQEAAEDRQQASKEEQNRVMERYKEALRPGGFWKFADE